MIVVGPQQGTGVAPPPRTGEPGGLQGRTVPFGRSITSRVLSAQLLMDMARVSPFQALEEERRNYKKFRKMNRQSLRLHQALLPLVSEDAEINVLAMRELVSSDGTVIGGGVDRGAPVKRYNVMVQQLALPMKVTSDTRPGKDMPAVPVGMHRFKLHLEGGTFPLEVEVMGQDNQQAVLQKVIRALGPFKKKLSATTKAWEDVQVLVLETVDTGERAGFGFTDGPEHFLDRMGLDPHRTASGARGGMVHRAQDAVIDLDGERFTSPTNDFNLQEKNGLKLRVHALSLKGPITLEVRRPERPVVKHFTKLTREMNEHLSFLGREESQLLSSVYHRYNGFLEGLSTGSDALAGLMLNDGKVALDEEALRTALHKHPDQLEDLLRGEGSSGKALFEEINSVLDTPMALGNNRIVFQPPLKDQPLVVFLTTSSPFLTTAMIAQTEGFFVNLFA